MLRALVTGADRGLGFAVCEELIGRGWRVFAGQNRPDWPELAGLKELHPDALTIVALDVASLESCRAAAETVGKLTATLDMLVSNAGVLGIEQDNPIDTGPSYEEIERTFSVNALGGLRVTEALLPLLAAADLKRLCYVSSEAGSIGASYRKSWYGYCMSKAALNMGVSVLFNDLRPRGYTFRLYHPGWIKSYMMGVKNEEATYTAQEAARMAVDYFINPTDEDRLALRSHDGSELPW